MALVALVALVAGFAPAEETFPIPLDSKTFSLFVSPEGLALVEFRQGGEPDPAFAHAARLLRDIMPLGTVDVEREPHLGRIYGVQHFPSVQLFRRGLASPYKGSMQVKELVYDCLEELDALVKEESEGPPRVQSSREQGEFLVNEEPVIEEPHPPVPHTQTLHAPSELLHLRKLEDVLLLGLFPDEGEEEEHATLRAGVTAGVTMREAHAAYVAAAERQRHEHLFLDAREPWLVRSLRERLGVGGAPPLLLLLRVGEPTLTYRGAWDAAEIVEWTHEHAYVPLLRLAHRDIQRRYVDEPVPSLLLLLPPSSLEQHASAADAGAPGEQEPYADALGGVRALSHDYRADLAFFVAEAAPRFAALASALALPFPPHAPRAALWEPTLQRRFVFPQPLEGPADTWAPQLRAFLEAFLDGQLAPTLRSADAPPPADAAAAEAPAGGGAAGGVRTVVARTFERDVLGAGRDVLLGYHAPWCEHCAGLDALLGELAEGAPPAGNATAADGGGAPPDGAAAPPLVAAMDVHANDMPDAFHVHRVPSLLLFRASAPRKPVVYSGRLEASAVWAWVASERAQPTAAEEGAAPPAHAAVEQRFAGLAAALAKAQRTVAERTEL